MDYIHTHIYIHTDLRTQTTHAHCVCEHMPVHTERFEIESTNGVLGFQGDYA